MTEEARWRAAAASVVGTSHVRTGTGCQDAAIVKVLHDAAGREVLAAVVSDGAGSASRAEAGSLLACLAVTEAIEVFFGEGGRLSDIALGTVRDWVALVQEAICGRAEDEGAVPRDYACTLIAAVVADDCCAVFQVGDGAAVVPDGDGWRWVHWPQHGEYLNTTFFVTDPDAQDNLAFALCPGQVNEIALFTDGIENLVLEKATRSVFANFFDGMLPAVRALETPGVDAALSGLLAKYLETPAVCARTDDDKTLVLATRLHRVRAATEMADESVTPV